MKAIFLIGLLFVGAVFCDEPAATDDIDDIAEEFVKSIKEKCEKSGQDFSEEKFEKAAEEVSKCFDEHLPTNPDELQKLQENHEEVDDICSDKRHVIKKCFEKMIPVIEDCCKPEEKYFPDFVLSAFDGLWDFACENKGDVFKQVNNATVTCFFDVISHDDVEKACGENYKVFRKDFPDDFIANKEDLCHDLDEAETCWSKFVSTVCPDEKHLQFIIAGVHKAISKPCH